MKSSDTFLGGQTYIAEIEITPQYGYIICAERSVTINGVPAYYSAGTDGTSIDAVVYRVAFTAEKVPLTGQVQFTSGAFPNQPIASELIGGNIIKALAADSVHYQWQMKEGYFWKDLTGVYSNRKNYVPTTDQLGKEIRVVITADGYEGAIAGKSLQVTKKYCQASPNCPPGVSVLMIDGQYTGMRVETNAGQDYVWRENMESDVSSIDWSVNAFTKPNNKDYVDIRGLIEGNTYYVYTRISETEDTKASTGVKYSSVNLKEKKYLQRVSLVGYTDYGEGNTIQIPLGGEVTIPLNPFPSEATSWSAFTIGDPTGLSPVYEVTNPTDKVQLTMPSSITLKGNKVGSRILQAYYNGGMYYYGTWYVHVYDPADPSTYQIRFTNRPAYPDITLNAGDSVMPIMPESGLMLLIEANDKFEYKWYVYSGCDSQGTPRGKAEENGYISIDPDTGKVTALSTEFDENEGSKYQPYAVLYFVNKSNSNQYGVVTKYKVNVVSGDIPVENVFIAPSIVNLTPGSTLMLSATVSPTNHTQNGYVVWSKKNGSDNITINPVTGEVTVSDAATNGEMATVRATFGNKYGECVINVSSYTEEEHIHTYAYSYTPANASAKTNGQRIKYCTNCYEISATLEINYPKAITLSSKSFVYNGKVQTPTVTVTDVNGKVIDKKHYDVSMPTDSKAMGKYNCKVTFKGNYYTGSLNASYVIVPKTTGIESLQNATDGIMIKWKVNTQATGYKILRSEDGTNFAAIKTIKDKSIVSYLDTVANENGKKYIYKIYAYNNAGGTTVTSAASTAKAIYRIDRSVISSITPVVGKIALEWKRIPNVSGYEIRYATDASFKENDNTIVIASETAYRKTITGLTSGKRYYFKIRAYKEVSGKKYYSAWSSAKSAVVK